jgi:hypothetical protein
MTAREALAQGFWVPINTDNDATVVVGFSDDGTQCWASIPPVAAEGTEDN